MQVRKADGFIDWLDQRMAIKKLVEVLATKYWVPKKMNFLWAMGVILLTLFTLLVVSGLFLLMYYKPDAKLAFDSVNDTIMREVAYGWLWRHIHAVAASMVFLIIYIHMFVAIYYGSYKQGREIVWIGGMLLFVLFSGEAFSGYMLPWGQMSFWAAAVITNLPSAIPGIGPDVVEWVRGNFVIADSTLTRFFMLHVCLMPIAILGTIALHFYTFRIPHINNEEGEEIDFEAEAKKYEEGKKKESKVIRFWPDFLSKDIFVVSAFMMLFFYLVCYHFDFAMDPINFDPANNLKTPAHIYPEWYFLWSYEILRGFFFSSDLGLMAFGVAQVAFLFIPFLDRSPVVAPAHKRPLYFVWFWIFIAIIIVLTIFGKLPPEGANNLVGFFAAIGFFIWLFIGLPVVGIMERKNAPVAKH